MGVGLKGKGGDKDGRVGDCPLLSLDSGIFKMIGFDEISTFLIFLEQQNSFMSLTCSLMPNSTM